MFDQIYSYQEITSKTEKLLNKYVEDANANPEQAKKGEHEKPRGSHRMMPSTGVKITTIIS